MSPITKEAFFDELVKIGGVLGAIGKAAITHPLQTTLGAATALGGIAGAKGKYKQLKTGFDPQVQNAMLGQVPTPPQG